MNRFGEYCLIQFKNVMFLAEFLEWGDRPTYKNEVFPVFVCRCGGMLNGYPVFYSLFFMTQTLFSARKALPILFSSCEKRILNQNLPTKIGFLLNLYVGASPRRRLYPLGVCKIISK